MGWATSYHTLIQINTNLSNYFFPLTEGWLGMSAPLSWFWKIIYWPLPVVRWLLNQKESIVLIKQQLILESTQHNNFFPRQGYVIKAIEILDGVGNESSMGGISVFTLKEFVTVSKDIYPICLPTREEKLPKTMLILWWPVGDWESSSWFRPKTSYLVWSMNSYFVNWEIIRMTRSFISIEYTLPENEFGLCFVSFAQHDKKITRKTAKHQNKITESLSTPLWYNHHCEWSHRDDYPSTQ